MLELTFDIASGATYKFNTAAGGEQVCTCCVLERYVLAGYMDVCGASTVVGRGWLSWPLRPIRLAHHGCDISA